LNIHSIIFQFQRSVGSWQSIATVEKRERKPGWVSRRKKEKREALIKHSSLLGRQRYIGKISSLSDEKIVSTYVRKENLQLIKQ
jgi:hypothetical protein